MNYNSNSLCLTMFGNSLSYFLRPNQLVIYRCLRRIRINYV
jgi:hypothetical protein